MSDDLNKPTLAYSFAATSDGTLVSADVVHTFPKDELFIYGNINVLYELLIEKDVEAWKALPEKLRSVLICTEEWQYHINEKTNVINLIINDLEIRWNGDDWVVQTFHPDIR